MKWLLSALFVFLPVVASGAIVTTEKSADGWRLLVDGKPYFVRGISYHLDTIPQDPNLGTFQDWMIQDVNDNDIYDVYETWVDSNTNNTQDAGEATVGDFSLMRQMGINTIRIYHHPSADPLMTACYDPGSGGDLVWNHETNKQLLRDAYYTYGIMSIMGDELGAYTTASCADWEPGTDYTDPVQIASMTYSVRKMVEDFKDEPWLLMYVLGNENNYDFTHTNAYANPAAYYDFVGDMVDLIHSLDPHHPVAIANGEVQFISTAALRAPNLDIWGMNIYRNPGALTGFGTAFQDVEDVWDLPVLLTEFGIAENLFSGATFLEDTQSAILKNYWCDIENHGAGRTTHEPKNAIGGIQYAWADNWWQNGTPTAFYTGTPNNEATGLISQGDGSDSPFMRQPRAAYYMYKRLWNTREEACPCPGRSAS